MANNNGNDRDDIYGRVVMVLADYISDRVTGIELDSSLVNDLGMDSLELMAAVTSLEQEFGLRVPDDAMSEIATVGELSAFIESRLEVNKCTVPE